ncbi:hypothetical protein Tco_0308732 [Tanacetum coccineum]
MNHEIRPERLASTANPLALVAQQQSVYHPQNHPNHNTQYSSTRSQQPTRIRGKVIVNSSAPIYDQEPATVTEDDEMVLRFSKSPGKSCVYNCKEYALSMECQKPKRVKNAAYITRKRVLCKQEVTPDPVDNSGPIFDVEPLHKDDQDGTDELDQERDLLAYLIKKLKCEIDDSKNRNKFLETSNKALVDKLKGKIEDCKTKNKSLESSNKYFKEANNELSKTNQLMFKDLKKFQAELDRYHDLCICSKCN